MVRVVGRSHASPTVTADSPSDTAAHAVAVTHTASDTDAAAVLALVPHKRAQVYFEEAGGFVLTPLYTLGGVAAACEAAGTEGVAVRGPALVMQQAGEFWCC